LFIFSLIISLISCTVFSLLVVIFPYNVRYTGVSLSFNLGITIFSSSTPVILMFVENKFHSFFAPGVYISLLSTILLLLISVFKNKLSILEFNKIEFFIKNRTL
jgi:MHS family proline/betaine transporter-like MFS transporter